MLIWLGWLAGVETELTAQLGVKEVERTGGGWPFYIFFVRWEYREITAKIRIELSELGWCPSASREDNEKANEERTRRFCRGSGPLVYLE